MLDKDKRREIMIFIAFTTKAGISIESWTKFYKNIIFPIQMKEELFIQSKKYGKKQTFPFFE
jgi:hypothetical protein